MHDEAFPGEDGLELRLRSESLGLEEVGLLSIFEHIIEHEDEAVWRLSSAGSLPIISQMSFGFLEELLEERLGEVPCAPDHVDPGVLVVPYVVLHARLLDVSGAPLILHGLLGFATAYWALVEEISLLVLLDQEVHGKPAISTSDV